MQETIDHESYHKLEEMFVEGYRNAKDKMLYLRMAHIPFELPPSSTEEVPYYLQQLHITEKVDVGHVAPAFASPKLVHQMFPHELVRSSTQLTFIYVNQHGIKECSLQELYQLNVVDHEHSH